MVFIVGTVAPAFLIVGTVKFNSGDGGFQRGDGGFQRGDGGFQLGTVVFNYRMLNSTEPGSWGFAKAKQAPTILHAISSILQ